MSAPAPFGVTAYIFAAFIANMQTYVTKQHERGFVDGMLAGVEICAEAGHAHRARRSRRPPSVRPPSVRRPSTASRPLN